MKKDILEIIDSTITNVEEKAILLTKILEEFKSLEEYGKTATDYYLEQIDKTENCRYVESHYTGKKLGAEIILGYIFDKE